jgi:hypothetical protein
MKRTTPTKQNKQHKRHHYCNSIPRDNRQRETNLIDNYANHHL